MALFVLVHAHSVDYRKTLLTFQIFFVFFHWFWVEESFAMGFNRSESLACRLLQQSTGKVSGAASKASLSNIVVTVCLVLVLLYKSGVILFHVVTGIQDYI